MSDHTPITGELRKYATVSWDPWPDARDRLYQMCDRIDAIHAGLERENAELRAARGDDCRDMSDAEYVKLHKDTGGEYINEHDKVDWRDHAGTWHENATVVAVCSDGCYVMDGTVFHVHKSDIRHHHAQTVEDVLTEFGIDWEYESDCEDRAALLKEYAKRLTLAEGEDA